MEFFKKNITLFVCTINYNNVNGLKKTLESYHHLPENINFIPIIIDSCSTDGSEDIINNLPDEYIKVIEKDSGIYDGMNKAIYIAYMKKSNFSKNYIIFMNSGDLFHVNVAKLNFDNLKYDVNIFRNYHDDGTPSPRFKLELLKFGFMPVCHQSIIYNIDTIKDKHLLYHTNTGIYNDYRQLVLLQRNKYSFGYREEYIAVYEQATTSGKSRSSWLFRWQKYKVIYNLFGILGIFKSIYFRLRISFFKSKYIK